MKWIAGVLGMLVSVVVSATEVVVFQCDLRNGTSVMVKHHIEDNVFTFLHGKDMNSLEVKIEKHATRLRTSHRLKQGGVRVDREIYGMSEEGLFYDVGYAEKNGAKGGYFQIMDGGTETLYSVCKEETLMSKFFDDSMFSTFAEVE